MNILGIDPGIARTGWGVIDMSSGEAKTVSFDCIETHKTQSDNERLVKLHNEIKIIIKKHKPDVAAIESLFFNTNAKTALTVGQARGVVILALAQENVNIAHYTPLQVKIAITGYGRADKNQLQQMVKTLLNLEQVPKPDDVADALSIALTHAYSRKHEA